jgi:hypothetical protein
LLYLPDPTLENHRPREIPDDPFSGIFSVLKINLILHTSTLVRVFPFSPLQFFRGISGFAGPNGELSAAMPGWFQIAATRIASQNHEHGTHSDQKERRIWKRSSNLDGVNP